MDDSIVGFLHFLKMRIELMQQLRSRWQAPELGQRHPASQYFKLGCLRRKGVCLPVVGELKTMFQVPQELICRSEARIFRVRQQILVTQTQQGQQSPAVADPGFAPPEQPLE